MGVRKTTKAARAALATQQASGTHNPAMPCPVCTTLRTPGLTHTPPDGGRPTCAN